MFNSKSVSTPKKDLRIRRLLDAYPIFPEYKQLGVKGLRAKIAIVAHITSVLTGQNYNLVLAKLCNLRGIEFELIPSIQEAAYHSGISIDFLTDYGKILSVCGANPTVNETNYYILNS